MLYWLIAGGLFMLIVGFCFGCRGIESKRRFCEILCMPHC